MLQNRSQTAPAALNSTKKSDLGMKIFKDFVIFVLRTKIPLAPDEVPREQSRMDFGAFPITFGSFYCIYVYSKHSRIKIEQN